MAQPNVETLGYYHPSLRDDHEILVALGTLSASGGDLQGALDRFLSLVP